MNDFAPMMVPGEYRFNDGSQHSWDGQRWVAPSVKQAKYTQAAPQGPISQEPTAASSQYRAVDGREGQAPQTPPNTKLAMLGALAVISALAGVIIFLAGTTQEDQGAAYNLTFLGGALFGGGISVWISWLGFGAVVDAINGLKA